MLLAAGADRNAKAMYSQKTPLNYAKEAGAKETIAALLRVPARQPRPAPPQTQLNNADDAAAPAHTPLLAATPEQQPTRKRTRESIGSVNFAPSPSPAKQHVPNGGIARRGRRRRSSKVAPLDSTTTTPPPKPAARPDVFVGTLPAKATPVVPITLATPAVLLASAPFPVPSAWDESSAPPSAAALPLAAAPPLAAAGGIAGHSTLSRDWQVSHADVAAGNVVVVRIPPPPQRQNGEDRDVEIAATRTTSLPTSIAGSNQAAAANLGVEFDTSGGGGNDVASTFNHLTNNPTVQTDPRNGPGNGNGGDGANGSSAAIAYREGSDCPVRREGTSGDAPVGGGGTQRRVEENARTLPNDAGVEAAPPADPDAVTAVVDWERAGAGPTDKRDAEHHPKQFARNSILSEKEK